MRLNAAKRYALEMVRGIRPGRVLVDPISNLLAAGTLSEVNSMMLRLIDFLKMRTITTKFTDQIRAHLTGVVTEEEIPSLFDTWLLLRDREAGDEHYTTLQIIKSRGIAHSKRVCEFLLTDNGIRLNPLTRDRI